MTGRLLTRLASMTSSEARSRAQGLWWQSTGRLHVLRDRSWRRQHLRRALADRSRSDTLSAVAQYLREDGDWRGVHRLLVQHFSTRASAFPIDARELPATAERIRATFDGAAGEAIDRAEAVIAGRYDVLGYQRLEWGSPPDWHLDPVSGRRAPAGYWANLDYLDPEGGDHKVIWELNRHQHWLTLGRAFRLTGDSRFRDEFARQQQSWFAANPPLPGSNWASMLELAFRSLTWLWALALFSTPDEDSAAPWTVDLLVGLDRQLLQIERHLSTFFSPNTHLTGEALALYVAGQCLPELAASRRRAAQGRTVLLNEIERQIAPDGAHRELSAHYQRYSTDFYLLASIVARRSGDSAAPAFEDAARRQARFLRTICDDLGQRPAIGDDDGGQLFPICGRPSEDCRDTLAIAATVLDEPELAVGSLPEEAYWLGLPCTPAAVETKYAWPSIALKDSGYCISRTADGDHLLFDAGPHGYLNGGHAHADALSVIVTLRNTPLLIDPGTATYTMDSKARDRFRSTAMHNTVAVDGRSQSVPRGPFHWQTIANAVTRLAAVARGCDYFEGSHDGYAPVMHTRGVLAVHGVGWFILDTLSGSQHASADVHWHFHPEWQLKKLRSSGAALGRGDRSAALLSTAPIEMLDTDHPARLHEMSRAYGRIEPSRTLRSRVVGSLPWCVLTFVTADAAAADGCIHPMAAISADDNWHAWAFDIALDNRRGMLIYSMAADHAASSTALGPPRTWGLPELMTNGRLALLWDTGDAELDAVLVHGSQLESPRVDPIDLPSRVALLRTRLTGSNAAQPVERDVSAEPFGREFPTAATNYGK
jgi:hypothetical protein